LDWIELNLNRNRNRFIAWDCPT